jgi:hypothetical protein
MSRHHADTSDAKQFAILASNRAHGGAGRAFQTFLEFFFFVERTLAPQR